MSTSESEKPVGGSGPTERGKRIKLESIIRSDDLVWVRDLLSSLPQLEKIHHPLFQIRLVIDADRVQRELRWRLRSRRNPKARSALQEVCDCGIVVLFAPTVLDQEIESHIDDIAEYANVSVDRVREEWNEFRSRITFHEPVFERPDPACPDPKDLPYKTVCQELGAHAVYTTDAHFKLMDVPVVTVDLDRVFRKHARAKSILLVVNLGSGFTLTISFQVLAELLRACRHGLERAPSWLKLGLVLLGAAALIHPQSRKKICDFGRALWRRLSDPRMRAALRALAGDLVETWEAVRTSSIEIENALPKGRRRSAIACIREICLRAKAPLSPAEIAAQMRRVGYVSRSANLRAYVGCLIRADASFVRVSRGKWTLRSMELPISA